MTNEEELNAAKEAAIQAAKEAEEAARKATQGIAVDQVLTAQSIFIKTVTENGITRNVRVDKDGNYLGETK